MSATDQTQIPVKLSSSDEATLLKILEMLYKRSPIPLSCYKNYPWGPLKDIVYATCEAEVTDDIGPMEATYVELKHQGFRRADIIRWCQICMQLVIDHKLKT